MFQIRLKKLRESKNMSQYAFAKDFGTAQSTVGGWESGKREPNFETMQKLADYFNVTVDYLLGREETPMSPSASGTWVPVLGNVQAGIPVEAVQDILDYEDISNITKDPSDYFALKIKGSSMEPRLCAGDVVIVKKQASAQDGDIVIALVNGDEATVKKFKKRPEGVMLIPLNPQFDTMFYSNDEIEKLPVSILGKVVELRGKL